MASLIFAIIKAIPAFAKIADEIVHLIIAERLAAATAARTKGIDELKNATTEEDVYRALSIIIDNAPR